MLYTSYHLAELAGSSQDCHGYKMVQDAIGGQHTEGIALSTVLHYAGLENALWCLRAVHGEQKTIARKAARLWMVYAARDAIPYYENQTLVEAIHVTGDRCHGLVSEAFVASTRKMLWDYTQDMRRPSRWAGLLVWLSLSDHPEDRCTDAMEAYEKAVKPQVSALDWEEHSKLMVGNFLKFAANRSENCAGPGVYDPSGMKETKYQKAMNLVVNPRPKRKYTRRMPSYDNMKGDTNGS